MTTLNTTQNHRVRNIILLALGLSIAALIGTILLSWMVFDNELLNSENACPPEDRPLIERAAGLTLPPSTAKLYARCINWQEWRGQLAFDMNPADLDAFLSSAEMETPLASNGKPELHRLFADDLESARIETVTTYLYGENRRPDVWQYILIDTADTALYRVHVLFGRD
jgi:hypothetical protein